MYALFSDTVKNGRPANAWVAITDCRRLPKEDGEQLKKCDFQPDSRTNKRVKVDKWAVSEAAAGCVTGKLKRLFKFNEMLNGCRRDVDERTRRDLDESDY